MNTTSNEETFLQDILVIYFEANPSQLLEKAWRNDSTIFKVMFITGLNPQPHSYGLAVVKG